MIWFIVNECFVFFGFKKNIFVNYWCGYHVVLVSKNIPQVFFLVGFVILIFRPLFTVLFGSNSE